jgi:hypothetical protein
MLGRSMRLFSLIFISSPYVVDTNSKLSISFLSYVLVPSVFFLREHEFLSSFSHVRLACVASVLLWEHILSNWVCFYIYFYVYKNSYYYITWQFILYTYVLVRNTYYFLILDVKIKSIGLYFISICGLTWCLEKHPYFTFSI